MVFSGKIHLLIAAIIWILFFREYNILWVLLGSLFPDTDNNQSILGRFIPLSKCFKHRGFTHTLQGMLLFMFPILIFDYRWCLAFGVGYLSHIVADKLI